MVNEIRRAWEDAMDVILDLEDWEKVAAIHHGMRQDRLKYLKRGPYVDGAGLPSERALHFEMALELALEHKDHGIVQEIKDRLKRTRVLSDGLGCSDKYWEVEYAITRMLSVGVFPSWVGECIRNLNSAEERLVAFVKHAPAKAVTLGLVEGPKGPEITDELALELGRIWHGGKDATIEDLEGCGHPLADMRVDADRTIELLSQKG